MPEYLQLPPAAQAIVAITALAVAIVRLLTASRSFWGVFPTWLQKGLPAFAMAVAAIPLAIEHSRTWLDIVLGFLAVIGTWYTASRGDKRPDEPTKPKAPVLPMLYLIALALFVTAQPGITGCSPASREAASANVVEKRPP